MKAEDQSAERDLFEKWAHDHLGQGYSMEREDHTYIDPVTRWAHKAWQVRAALSAREAPARPSDDKLPEVIDQRLQLWLTLGKEMHPYTINLVVRFARALAAKLADAEAKYGYSDGWADKDWKTICADRLIEHLSKGDPRDVAAYCAFMWHHGWKTRAELSYTPAPAREGWQPIETAPKDGSELLVFREDAGVFLAAWTCADSLRTMTDKERDELDENSLFQEDWFGGDAELGGFRLEGGEVPTHWMPLPAPPVAPTTEVDIPATNG